MELPSPAPTVYAFIAPRGEIESRFAVAVGAWGWMGYWSDLWYIVNAESTWHPNARNGRYWGLCQLDGDSTPADDIETQAWKCLGYIQGRYGNPGNAAAFRRSHNWF
ncbi:MAG: aggregation-promoting factor C-terminal-like domain-containing protein [Candidatus Dormibacteria bacterium]